MKIIQSLWTRPTFKKDNFRYTDRNRGGWTDKKYNYMSWALSCLQFRKYYNQVELITDTVGFDLLINKLELPYTRVHVCLDALNNYHHDLWALGKIYAYSIQDEPFIHADGDVFIYERFTEAFEGSDLVAQNIEKQFTYYNEIFKNICDQFAYLPETLVEFRNKHNSITGANAGIIGGNDILFFKEYSSLAFKFVDRNVDKIDKINTGMFNNVFEQFLFYAMAENKGIDINFYKQDVNQAFDGLSEFTSLPNKSKFIHTVGVYKRMEYIGEQLAFRLLEDHPDYYYKIVRLLRTNLI